MFFIKQKKTGEFFVTTGFDREIVPIDLESAKEWIEEKCSVETYEEVFGTVEE